MITTTPLPLPRAAAPLSVAHLKRLDCLGFTRAFPAAQRAKWDEWADRLWWADELAERDHAGFAAEYACWERVLRPPGIRRAACAWSRYLAALDYYHRPGLVIQTLAEHDEMLLRLSGPLLQLAPGMPDELWEAAAHFGALDQFYNNLRDMYEDAERGLCWLPEDVLREYGIMREDVIAGRSQRTRPFLFWWIGTRARLERSAAPFVTASLPPPLMTMRGWTLRRYERIHRVLRAVDYDYRRFPERYWAEVRMELEVEA